VRDSPGLIAVAFIGARDGRQGGGEGRLNGRSNGGRRESKEKAYFCNYANGARGPSVLGWPVGFGLREKRG
jgi:hypothetical protein